MYYCASNIVQEVRYTYRLLTMKTCSEFSYTKRTLSDRHRHFKNKFPRELTLLR